MGKINFPKWLPSRIAQKAHSVLSSPHSPETKDIVTILTTRTEMKPVWEKLSQNKTQPRGRQNLLGEILSSMSYWDFMKEEGLLLTPHERKKCTTEITNAIASLRDALKKNHLHVWHYDPDVLNPIDLELDEIEAGLERSLFWKELPTKMATESAKKTFLIKKLKSFMANEYQQPFHAEIATIISLIFNDPEITDDHIRKA